jgi:16S rRNA (uracil1498-N3)-methyltransferase
MNLREVQGNHSLILLQTAEYAALRTHSRLTMPHRHSEHFGKVMRRQPRWGALVSNGKGAVVQAEVDSNLIHITSEERQLTRDAQAITLIQAWTKQKALSFILQKSAEIGVDTLVLVNTQYSAEHSDKLERMQTILETACMQAHNVFKPEIRIAGRLLEHDFAISGHCFGDISKGQPIAKFLANNPKPAAFVNGPEGGFTAAESEWLRARASGILISENVLRAETAAIIVMGLLKLRS